jgi:hypothetical protein
MTMSSIPAFTVDRGWIWLHELATASPHAKADSTRVIGQVFGGAMALILALSPLLYLMARKNDRR